MNSKIFTLLTTITLAFSLVAFIAPFPRTPGFWTAYIFGIIAIAAQCIFFKKAFFRNNTAKSRMYGFPLARVGVIYLALQLLISIIEMTFANTVPFWIYLVLNAIILVATISGFIAAETAREEIVKQENIVVSNTATIRTALLAIQQLLVQSKSQDYKAKLDNLYEAVRFSDPVSSKSTAEIDIKFDNALSELHIAIAEGDQQKISDLIDLALSLLNERHAICKLHK